MDEIDEMELQVMMMTEFGRNKLMLLVKKDRLKEIRELKNMSDKLALSKSLGIFKSEVGDDFTEKISPVVYNEDPDPKRVVKSRKIKKPKVKSRHLAESDKTNVKEVRIPEATVTADTI